ncbi:type II toxin-antitoxin system RelE/ParE family toxin [Paraburkholderia sp. 40]|uniref:type II toxin-antitoxin system RelE/ParE family toxin n=1 Tax=Paraburkholderia sp. 40 TaxID=2991059 RepID=UPI003D1E35C5
MRRLEWKVQAENDLFDILDYIGQDNPDAALELVRKIRAKADGLRTRPRLDRAGRMHGTREMIVHRNSGCPQETDFFVRVRREVAPVIVSARKG